MDADPAELRVLGCLIEKQRTTPDAYPLSLNSLRLACNQSTNRDPVVDYDEATIRWALDELSRRGWVRLASGAGSRAIKYRHLFDEALGLADDEIALLAVLMLRGPQTPGELKTRTERLHHFAGLEELGNTLDRLVERRLAESLGRRPGQREERYRHLLGAEGDQPAAPAAEVPAPAPDTEEPARAPVTTPSGDASESRIERLEREVEELRSELRALRDRLDA